MVILRPSPVLPFHPATGTSSEQGVLTPCLTMSDHPYNVAIKVLNIRSRIPGEERPLKNLKFYCESKLDNFFRYNTRREDQNCRRPRLFITMKSPFYRHLRHDFIRIPRFFLHGVYTPLDYEVFNLLDALKRLNANCRNKAFIAFLASFGNLTRFTLLYKS